MSAVRIDSLSKIYRSGWERKETNAVRNLSFEVKEGEIFGFLGPNGAGKTTTIHLLLNLLRPTTGAAFLFEQPVTSTAVRKRIGYLPESVNLHSYYNGGKLLNFYGELCGMPSEGRSKRTAELLKLLKLEEASYKRVSAYSKGMAQRLGFAQAMMHDPDLLILDEPTASLDPVGRKEFRDILIELKRRGKTVFISSHILSEVETVCDRVAILERGELKRVGTLQELSAGGGARITAKGLTWPVLEVLASTPAEITLIQGLATIRCPDDALRQMAEGLLREHGAEILRIETQTQTLEQIFFSTIEAPPKL